MIELYCNAQRCMSLWLLQLVSQQAKSLSALGLARSAADAVLCIFYREARALWTTCFRARWCRA